jgi:hypothetical protein
MTITGYWFGLTPFFPTSSNIGQQYIQDWPILIKEASMADTISQHIQESPVLFRGPGS